MGYYKTSIILTYPQTTLNAWRIGKRGQGLSIIYNSVRRTANRQATPNATRLACVRSRFAIND